jgi:hypothetical protein
MVQSTNTADSFHTRLISSKQSSSVYGRLIIDLRRVLRKLHKNDLIFNYGQKVAIAKPCDLVRVLAEWSQDDVLDLTIRNLIVDAVVSSENKVVGSGLICAMAIASIINVDIKSYPKRHKGRAELDELDHTIRYMTGNGLLSNLISRIIKSGGLGASIMFDTTTKNDFTIESIAASKIDGYVHPLFDLKSRQINLPRMICLDGIIESVGEIDNILQQAADDKCWVIICARGFHPDIVNTLSENSKEGRLNVIPFVVRQWAHDEENAIIACNSYGLDCMTRDEGQTLNTKSLDDFSVIESVYIAAQHIAIHSLSGDSLHMCVRVPKRMQSILGIIEDRVRITLQACISVSKSGLLASDTNSLPSVSYDALHVGLRSANACIKNVESLGCMVIPDTN